MWKKYQNSQKSAKNLKLAFLGLGLLVFLLVLGKTAGFIASFAKPFNSELSSSKQYTWGGKSSINLGFAQIDPLTQNTKSVAVISYSPKDEKASILHISNLVYSELPKNYGSWRMESVYKLGQEENPKVGAELLKMSLSKLIGLPIDGVMISGSGEDKIEDQISSWDKNPFSIISFISNIKTDLTPIETAKIIWSLRGVRDDKLVSLDFANSSITESKLLPDSSRVLGIDNIRLDSFIRQNLSDSGIIEENLTVAVFNATPHAGLASQASRIVANLGANVVILTTAENTVEKSQLILKAEDQEELFKSITYRRLAEAFAPHCLEKPCQTQDSKVSSSRAQISIVLGEDYFQHWYNKK